MEHHSERSDVTTARDLLANHLILAQPTVVVEPDKALVEAPRPGAAASKPV